MPSDHALVSVPDVKCFVQIGLTDDELLQGAEAQSKVGTNKSLAERGQTSPYIIRTTPALYTKTILFN